MPTDDGVPTLNPPPIVQSLIHIGRDENGIVRIQINAEAIDPAYALVLLQQCAANLLGQFNFSQAPPKKVQPVKLMPPRGRIN